jgi:hypothetical protein
MWGHRLLGALLAAVGSALGGWIVWVVYDPRYSSQTLAIAIGIPGTLIISLFAVLVALAGVGLVFAPGGTRAAGLRLTRGLRPRRPF